MNPLPTTTITLRRPAGADDDPTEAPTVSTVATGHPATIGSPSGSEVVNSGERELVDAVLVVADLAVGRLDLVDDDETGDTWQVVWSRQRRGLGLDHVRAGLRRVTP